MISSAVMPAYRLSAPAAPRQKTRQSISDRTAASRICRLIGFIFRSSLFFYPVIFIIIITEYGGIVISGNRKRQEKYRKKGGCGRSLLRKRKEYYRVGFGSSTLS